MIDLKSALRGVKEHGAGQYSGYCPLCEKDKTSGDGHLYFSLSQEGDKWLVDCKHGCGFNDICSALNVDPKELYEDKTDTVKQSTSSAKVREHIYYDANSNIVGKKAIFRESNGDKYGVWYRYENGGYASGLNGVKMPMYHLHNLAIHTSGNIYITEGEKDVETLERLGFTATTCPNGAHSAKIPAECMRYFEGKHVVLLGDNDEAGVKYVDVLYNALRKHAESVVIVSPLKVWENTPIKGDISDIAQALGDDETLKRLKQATAEAYNEDLYHKPYMLPDGDGGFTVNPQLLAQYIKDNVQYFYIGSGERGYIYVYDNGIYKPYGCDEFKGLIKKQLPLLEQKSKVYEEAYKNLRNECESRFYKKFDELNSDENIINFQNGVYHIDTGELTEHTPDIISTIQIPCDYNSNAAEPTVFFEYLDTLTRGNNDAKALLMEYLGLCISNVYGYRTKKTLILYGEGDTGKSQYRRLITMLVGKENSSSIDLSQLGGDKFGTSAIYGKRVAGSADMSFMRKTEIDTFKEITGGDEVKCEFKGKDSFHVQYRGVLLFCANKLPKFIGDKGEHTYNRIIPLYCDNVVPCERQDKKLLEKMFAEREGIVLYALKYLKRLIKNNYQFTIPQSCVEALKAYKVDNDNVLRFIEECTEPRVNGIINRGEGDTTGKVYRAFCLWLDENGEHYKETRNEFLEALERNGIGEKKKTRGNTYYTNFRLTLNACRNYYVSNLPSCDENDDDN